MNISLYSICYERAKIFLKFFLWLYWNDLRPKYFDFAWCTSFTNIIKVPKSIGLIIWKTAKLEEIPGQFCVTPSTSNIEMFNIFKAVRRHQ